MGRYRKLLTMFIFSLSCLILKGQDSVFYHITINTDKICNSKRTKKKKREDYNIPMFLFIDNKSSDTLHIENYNKYVVSDFESINETQAFRWKFLSLYGSEPNDDDILIISGFTPLIITDNDTLKIPPNTSFVSEIFLLRSYHIFYPEGFYKLCLIGAKTQQCVAEMVYYNKLE
jgi:hypothetical protein